MVGAGESSTTLKQLRAQARQLQQYHTRAVQWTLITSVAAGFIALIPHRVATATAAILLLISVIASELDTRRGWRDRWYETRRAAEACKSVLLMHRLWVPPYDQDDRDEVLAHNLGRYKCSRPTEQAEQVATSDRWQDRRDAYVKDRVDDQIDYYSTRAIAGDRRLRTWQKVSRSTYAVVLGIAVLQLFGAWEGEAVGPFVAVAASASAWATEKRWVEHTRLYGATLTQLRTLRESLESCPDADAFNRIVQQAESLLSSEHTHWLRLTKPPLDPQHENREPKQ
ncbi:DUF4231 domain-containing protein [Ornithinimicrobium faecis]|uniref:DUF4231 domain-containing protein n=1 Tax=Ornithinimicrobium faecis TaxID=2934158 RepID=UPI003CE50415